MDSFLETVCLDMLQYRQLEQQWFVTNLPPEEVESVKLPHKPETKTAAALSKRE